MDEQTGGIICDFCKVNIPDGGWIDIEVSRPINEDVTVPATHELTDYVSLIFCSETCVGQYMMQGLLPSVTPYELSEVTLRQQISEWFVITGVVSGILLALYLFGLGAWTLIGRLFGL